MAVYETVFMIRQDLTETQVKELTDKFSNIIKEGGGTILKIENWGLRTLAYKIKKSRKAHYVLIESEAPGPAIIELERNLQLNEDVMRSLTTRRKAPSKGQSPILEREKRYDEADTNTKEAA